MNKKQIRYVFRTAVLDRDMYECRMCGAPDTERPLDVHHVTDRTLMPNGGYVPDNGISLCPQCHEWAEEFHDTGTPHPGYSPEELYLKIGSGYDKAVKASEKLK